MTPAPESGLERFSLAGRVVLVTGATRGLGLEIARGMAGAGAVVGINGRDAKQADEVAKELPGAFAAAFDITDVAAAPRSCRGTAASIAWSTTRRCAIGGPCTRSRPTTFAA